MVQVRYCTNCTEMHGQQNIQQAYRNLQAWDNQIVTTGIHKSPLNPVATSRDLSLELSIFMLHNRSRFSFIALWWLAYEAETCSSWLEKYVFCWMVIFTGFLITGFNWQNEGCELRYTTHIVLQCKAPVCRLAINDIIKHKG